MIKVFEDILNLYKDEDLASLIPKQMLKLSEKEKLTVQFVFWFCHIVEQDLNSALELAATATNEQLGKVTPELDDFIRNNYKIKLEKIDQYHPLYNPNDITFGDRIYAVEKMRGSNDHTKFLWKVKKIRDDLSHGRINELIYENRSLYEIETKKKILRDYVNTCLNPDK